MIKRIIAFVLAIVMLSFAAAGCAKKTPALIYDGQGNVMASVTYTGWGYVELEDEGYASYVDLVIREAVSALAKKWDVTEEKAEKRFVSEGYVVETVFDKNVFESLESAQTDIVDNVAISVTDLNGAVLAVFSRSDEYNEQLNLANEKFLPCSAFKPLSVYAPAIETGKINWSTMTFDSPVKEITDEYGKKRQWPSNASGIYTEENMGIEQAVKESINTVAVKTLMDLGVETSMSFLNGKLGIDTTYESQVSTAYGVDEVLANLGLGYLKAGVTVVDMAGYYQIFANKGVYTNPYTVKTIKTTEGEVIYEAEPESVQVISEECAYVMSHLLQSVVEKGGTGQAAGSPEKIIAGKTGTGDNEQRGWTDNWFVGFTPQYTCAVWHSSVDLPNTAAALFADATKNVEIDGAADFSYCAGVVQVAYCKESGKRLGEKCTSMDVGYYIGGKAPEKCDEH